MANRVWGLTVHFFKKSTFSEVLVTKNVNVTVERKKEVRKLSSFELKMRNQICREPLMFLEPAQLKSLHSQRGKTSLLL